MSIVWRILPASAACLAVLVACNSSNSAKDAVAGKDGVAATVNGAPVSERLVDSMLKHRTDLGRPVDDQARRLLIDRMATQLVIAEEAAKKGLDKQPEVVDRLELARQSVLIDAFVQDYQKSNPITDEMLKAEYERIKAEMQGNDYSVRHIVVEKEGDARDIITRLKKNVKSFEALAAEKSIDPGSKGRGGNLGWLDPHAMPPELSAALSKLAKGKFTEEPVKTKFGYHVLLLEDSRLKRVQSFDQLKQAMTQQLQQRNLQTLFADLKAKAKIEFAKAPSPAPAEKSKQAEPEKK